MKKRIYHYHFATSSFAALAAFIAVFESLIPMPLPFIRLGLANIPICLGLRIFKFKEILFICSFKIITSHLIRGSLLAFPFFASLVGTFFFLAAIYLVLAIFKDKISFLSIAVVGAYFHNLGQLVVSSFFVPLQTIIYLYLFATWINTGFITGGICDIQKISWRLT